MKQETEQDSLTSTSTAIVPAEEQGGPRNSSERHESISHRGDLLVHRQPFQSHVNETEPRTDVLTRMQDRGAAWRHGHTRLRAAQGEVASWSNIPSHAHASRTQQRCPRLSPGPLLPRGTTAVLTKSCREASGRTHYVRVRRWRLLWGGPRCPCMSLTNQRPLSLPSMQTQTRVSIASVTWDACKPTV